MLQFITHQTPRFGIIEGAVATLNGGCKWIQLRMKDAPIEAVRQTAQQLIPLCKEHEAILVGICCEGSSRPSVRPTST